MIDCDLEELVELCLAEIRVAESEQQAHVYNKALQIISSKMFSDEEMEILQQAQG